MWLLACCRARVLCGCRCCRMGVLYVCGRRPAGARGPCGRHLVESRGPLIATQALCAHVFVIAHGSVAASSPRGSSVEPDHTQPSPNLPMRQNLNLGIYYASLHGKMEGLVRVIKNREWETAPVVMGCRGVVENMVVSTMQNSVSSTNVGTTSDVACSGHRKNTGMISICRIRKVEPWRVGI